MVSDKPVLEVKNLEIEYAGEKIFDPQNLTVNEGDLVWLKGPNGSGKSSFLRAIAGLIPYRGTIEINGHKSLSISGRKNLFYVSDEPALQDELTLQEHAFFWSSVYKKSKDSISENFEKFKLSKYSNQYPRNHSRGMRQKTALAIAFGLKTPLLVLDEPFNALDQHSRDILVALITQSKLQGRSIVITNHFDDFLSGIDFVEKTLGKETVTENV